MMRLRLSASFVVSVLAAAMSFVPQATAQTSTHECDFCHVMHSSPGPTLAIAEDVEILCLSCHGPAGTSALKAEAHANSIGSAYGTFHMTCVDCHTPHSSMTNWLGGTNLKQVGGDPNSAGVAQIATPSSGIRDVVFESQGTDTGQPSLHSFADSDEDGNTYYDGVCETCHTLASHHRNDASDPHHYPGATCTACHPHDAGFLPTGGCTDCHNVPQDNGDGVPPGGRRAVAQDGATLNDFGNVSHHVQGDVQDGDCVACHDLSQHMQGHVRLENPDDSGIVYVYDQATADDIESFCLDCHDADGATAGSGTQPFSDGQTVPDVDRGGLWAASAHSTGGTTNSGYVCTDCHGNGHGSNLRKLLLPWDGSPGPDNVNEEEGFCYGCHGSAGVINEAISNGWFAGLYENFGDEVQAAFGMYSTHPVNDSAPGHVLDIGNGPQELECTSCHGVHQGTGRYWAAASGHTPVTLPGTDELWGDNPTEKIGQYDPNRIYQAPSLGEPGLDASGNALPIDGSGDSLLTDAVLPDYNSLCLECHQHSVGDVVAIDWVAKKHGSAAAEPEGDAGWPLASPFVTGNRGQYFLGCLDCHEAHGSENIWLVKRSVNGSTVPDVLTGASNIEWTGVCDQCHASAPQSRHHNDDVYNKLGMPPGNPNCNACHFMHHGEIYVDCTTSGCHGHGGFF